MSEHEESLLDILLDPNHMLAEVLSHVFIEALILLVLAPFFKRYVKREHQKIDDEHGVDNHGRGKDTHTYKYAYYAGTGNGDDKDTWTCSCGCMAFSKASIEAHMNYHR